MAAENVGSSSLVIARRLRNAALMARSSVLLWYSSSASCISAISASMPRKPGCVSVLVAMRAMVPRRIGFIVSMGCATLFESCILWVRSRPVSIVAWPVALWCKTRGVLFRMIFVVSRNLPGLVHDHHVPCISIDRGGVKVGVFVSGGSSSYISREHMTAACSVAGIDRMCGMVAETSSISCVMHSDQSVCTAGHGARRVCLRITQYIASHLAPHGDRWPPCGIVRCLSVRSPQHM